jgi:hypothetical protein
MKKKWFSLVALLFFLLLATSSAMTDLRAVNFLEHYNIAKKCFLDKDFICAEIRSKKALEIAEENSHFSDFYILKSDIQRLFLAAKLNILLEKAARNDLMTTLLYPSEIKELEDMLKVIEKDAQLIAEGK